MGAGSSRVSLESVSVSEVSEYVGALDWGLGQYQVNFAEYGIDGRFLSTITTMDNQGLYKTLVHLGISNPVHQTKLITELEQVRVGFGAAAAGTEASSRATTPTGSASPSSP